jgi:hypothetical protein
MTAARRALLPELVCQCSLSARPGRRVAFLARVPLSILQLGACCLPLLHASNSLAVRAVETSRVLRSSVRTTSLQFQYSRH